MADEGAGPVGAALVFWFARFQQQKDNDVFQNGRETSLMGGEIVEEREIFAAKRTKTLQIVYG